MEKNEYIGIYDHKESNTFRPTLKSRIHKKSPVSKTMTCREDSCCVITKDKTHTHTHLIFALESSLLKNA